MLELIEEIIQAENEAEKTIQKANETAAGKKQSVEEELQARITATRDKAKEDAKRRIDATREKIDEARIASLDPGSEIAGFLEKNGETVDRLVDDIVTRILQTELERS